MFDSVDITIADRIHKGRRLADRLSSLTEQILNQPRFYIDSIEKHEQFTWVWEDDKMVRRNISYVLGLYGILAEILVKAAEHKQQDPKMDTLKVNIDVDENCISVYNNGDGFPVVISEKERVYLPEVLFRQLLASGEITVETADGKHKKRYKQVFKENMTNKSEPTTIEDCESGENWSKVSFKPDLVKFGMERLEKDVVALMKKRVVDLAASLGESVNVELDGKPVPTKTFEDYMDLYLPSNALRIYEKVNEKWEICVSMSDGDFQQVSFVNNIPTIKGGAHVNYIADQVANHLVTLITERNKTSQSIDFTDVKNHLWVFVNALIDNPSFDILTKQTLLSPQTRFGSTCILTRKFLKKVAKSGIVEGIFSWLYKKECESLIKKTNGNKKRKLNNIPILKEANYATTQDSDMCTGATPEKNSNGVKFNSVH